MGQTPPTPDEARRFLIARFNEEMANTLTDMFSPPMRSVMLDDALHGKLPLPYRGLKALSDADALRLYLAFLKESMKS